ncbi:MAG: hypothetical protein IKA17_02550 [Clostridia bacterium]|nr:hypothetical protein [Clostridia bacterium]
MKDKLVAFMLYLGENQWDDSPIRINARGSRYQPKLTTDRKVWREITDFAVEQGFNAIQIPTVDGVKYKSHPEIAIDGAWEVEELREELCRLREIGLTPIPELNFSTGHDIWLGEYSRMVSTPIYYEVVRDLIHENIEIFDTPEFFMMDQDEETHIVQRRMDFVCFRQNDLLWHDIEFMHNCMREKGVRPIMAVDLFANHKEDFLKHVKKDVVIMPWYYLTLQEDAKEKLPKLNDPADWENYNKFLISKIESYSELPKLGYDVFPMVSDCYKDFGIDHSIKHIANDVPEDKLLGVTVAPWFGCTTEEHKYAIMDSLVSTQEAINKHWK